MNTAETIEYPPPPEIITESDGKRQPPCIGIDDGYAITKLALDDGRMISIPSRARVGQAHITWLEQHNPRVVAYETDGIRYSVGALDGDATRFSGYPSSGLNRVIVQHALQRAGLAGQSIHATSGLPVSAFYQSDGTRREQAIEEKQANLLQCVQPLHGALPVGIAFHHVIPEALAAWYDYVIRQEAAGPVLDTERAGEPMAIIDIGGRTTDYVVIQDQGIVHDVSGSLTCGMLDVKQRVGERIAAQFNLESMGERMIERALNRSHLCIQGHEYPVAHFVEDAQHEIVARIHAETRRHLGQGVELARIVFVGGGSVALADELEGWFPHQEFAEHPAFANARGMRKYLRYVCEENVCEKSVREQSLAHAN